MNLIEYNKKYAKVGNKIKIIKNDFSFIFADFNTNYEIIKIERDNIIAINRNPLSELTYSRILKWNEFELVRNRGFEIVSDEYRQYPNIEIQLPKRGSIHSAGYDICTPVKIVIPPHGISDAIQTDIKAYMKSDEVLKIYPRSSLGFKKGLMLVNTVGIIDSDYYENPSNDGNIGFKLKNLTDKEVVIEAGERVMQGIFEKYLITDDDDCVAKRTGGIGSTN